MMMIWSVPESIDWKAPWLCRFSSAPCRLNDIHITILYACWSGGSETKENHPHLLREKIIHNNRFSATTHYSMCVINLRSLIIHHKLLITQFVIGDFLKYTNSRMITWITWVLHVYHPKGQEWNSCGTRYLYWEQVFARFLNRGQVFFRFQVFK
jgi:hypothetical protein